MFIGHYGIGFALKRAAPDLSLGLLVAAVQLPDLLWPLLLLAGVERVAIEPGNTRFTPLSFEHYPYSHSLLLVAVWGLALGAVLLRRRRPVAGLVAAAAVVSHWVLDWVTHRPDLPLVPWSESKAGLGLWNSIPATLAIEGTIFAAGVWLYARHTRGVSPEGRIGFRLFVAFLVAVYAANLLGPPPPDVTSLALVASGLWLLPFWAARFDRRRAPSSRGTALDG